MQGHVRKRHTWEFIVDIGRDPLTGRRRQKSKSGFATRREAERALHEFIMYTEGRGNPSPERISLADYLGRWLDYQRTRGSRPRTLEGYEGYIRREIVPVIGGLDVPELRPGHIRAVLSRMQERGLSATTIAQVRSVLGSALRQAVADGLIWANPVAAGSAPGSSGGSRTGQHLRSSAPSCWYHGVPIGKFRSSWPVSPAPAEPRFSACRGETRTWRAARCSSVGVFSVRHTPGVEDGSCSRRSRPRARTG